MAEASGQLPTELAEKLKAVVRDLEEHEGVVLTERKGGEIELKFNEDEAMWYISYRTISS